MENVFALKGIILHTPTFEKLEYYENQYVVCKDGKSVGIFATLPEEYKDIKVYDYTDKFIIPGMCDMHVHAPQYGFRGMGNIMENDAVWTSWFEQYSLPEESRYKDLEYAEKAYGRFVDDMLKTTTTTRASIFASIHRPATEVLMRKLADAGLVAYVGKLNMDRNSLPGYQETTEESLEETEKWIQETQEGYGSVKPMITPRYTPTCTDELMEGLQKLVEKYDVPVQSHLSEGLDEIEWVKELKPGISCYGEAYDMYGMLGRTTKTVQAHVVYSTDVEYELLKQCPNLWVAHCPESNMGGGNIAPIMKMIGDGIHVGLGTDVAGGQNLSLLRAMVLAIHVSKIRWNFLERNGDPFAKKKALTMSNAFYLATKGGGSFWGKVGSFEKDFEFDAVVLDYEPLKDFIDRPIYDRFTRIVENHTEQTVWAKYVQGKQVYTQDK